MKIFMKKRLLAFLTLFAAVAPLIGATLSWDLTKPDVPDFSQDFKELGKQTSKGFEFTVPDDRYGTFRFQIGDIDCNRFPYLEIYSGKGDNILYSLLFYGPNEGGYESSRSKSCSYVSNHRFFQTRTIEKLDDIPRWKQGGVTSFIFTVSNSGLGSSSTLTALALRRGRDTLVNGALMLHSMGNQPDAWLISNFKGLAPNRINGLPAALVAGGTADTELDTLCKNHRYHASFYALGLEKAEIRIFGANGALQKAIPFVESAKGFWELEYIVDEVAFAGVLHMEFTGEGAFGDVLVEDMGGKDNFRANWIWTASGTKDNQNIYFRREFTIKDPDDIKAAFLQATCDDAFTMEVNNNRIFNANNWGNVQYTDVKKYLLPGKNVMTANGHNGVSLAGFLAELKLTDKKGSIKYICTDASWLVNDSNPGNNWRRVDPPEETTKGWNKALELGVPPMPPWGNAVKYRDKMPEPLKNKPIDKEAFAKRKNTYRIGELNGYPILEINGEQNQPLIFGLRWKGDRTENYRTSVASGFKVFRLEWELSFEAWKKDGSIDMTSIDKEVEELLTAEPDAKILLMSRVSSPAWWNAKHPDELIVFADGVSNGGDDGPFASPASSVWLDTVTEMYGRAIRQVESKWYGNAILGYMPCNLRGPEWVMPAKHNCYADYSKPILKYFRKYLREKYGNDEAALQAAWKNPNVTFDTAEIPKLERRQGKNEHFLNDDCQDVIDYNRTIQRANTDAIMRIMDTISENAPGKLRWLYFGYLMTLDHLYMTPSYTGHYDVMRILDAGKVDVMGSPISYLWRRPGDISGCGSVEDSYRHHNVLWLQEADNRTYLTPTNDEHRVTFHPMASLYENRREFIYAAVNRLAIWFYDLGGEWYDSPFFHGEFLRMQGLQKQIWQTPVTWKAEVAYFFDEKNEDGVALRDGRWGRYRPMSMASTSQRSLALSGVPYDIYELEDIFSIDLSQYKVLFFPNAWRRNPKLAAFLKEKVFAAGKTAVFLYAPGYGQGGGVAGIEEITGIHVRELPVGTALQYKNASGKIVGSVGMHGQESFAIDDADATVVGLYTTGDKKPAAAVKRVSSGLSILLPTPDLSGETTRNICRSAGVASLIDKADRVVFDGTYLGIVPIDAPGIRKVTLPGSITATVAVECFTGREFPIADGTFSISLEPGQAALFRLK